MCVCYFIGVVCACVRVFGTFVKFTLELRTLWNVFVCVYVRVYDVVLQYLTVCFVNEPQDQDLLAPH